MVLNLRGFTVGTGEMKSEICVYIASGNHAELLMKMIGEGKPNVGAQKSCDQIQPHLRGY